MVDLARFWKIVGLIVLVGLTWGGQAVRAQDSPLQVTVDRTELSTDDRLTLSVTVRGTQTGLPQPALPTLPDFNIEGQSNSSQMTLINGDLTVNLTSYYVLRPIQTGTLTIPSISITIDGQTYTSAPIEVTVRPGMNPVSGSAPSASPQTLQGQNFFIEAEVDKLTPYIGEQVIYTFRFYSAQPLGGQPRYESPGFTGFWHEQLADQNQYTLQASGRTYRITEVQTVLFPTIPGETVIEPALLNLPGGFGQAATDLTTNPLTLTVQALPPNAPADFGEAVGLFSLEAEISETTGQVNEPLTLIVTLSGQGNFQTLSDPDWPDIEGWRSFDDETTLDTAFESNRLAGRKVYKRLLVPGSAGEFTLPPITYSYFDPAEQTYRTLSTDPIEVSIAPGAEELPTPSVAGANREMVERRADEIQPLKAVPDSLRRGEVSIITNPAYWLTWLLPALLIAGSLYWQRRQQILLEEADKLLWLNAGPKAQRAIENARRIDADAYVSVGSVLNTYLAEKLGRPVAGLTQDELAAVLQMQGIGADLIQRVKLALAEAEMGRFSPNVYVPERGGRLLNELHHLVDELDKAFEKGQDVDPTLS